MYTTLLCFFRSLYQHWLTILLSRMKTVSVHTIVADIFQQNCSLFMKFLMFYSTHTDGHTVVRMKLSSVVDHDVHSCELIDWKVCDAVLLCL